MIPICYQNENLNIFRNIFLNRFLEFNISSHAVSETIFKNVISLIQYRNNNSWEKLTSSGEEYSTISVQRLEHLIVPRFCWLLFLLQASLYNMYGVPVSTCRKYVNLNSGILANTGISLFKKILLLLASQKLLKSDISSTSIEVL